MENLDFFNKVKGFFLSPIQTFQDVKDEAMRGALRYFIAWLIIYSILFAIIISLMGPVINPGPIQPIFDITVGIFGAIALFFIVLISGIIGLVIGAAIMHLFVILVGGKQGYAQTLKATVYAATPMYLIGWIPLLGFAGGIWSFILVILGLRELHGISTGRAFLAAILPGLIITGVATAIVLTIGYPF